MADRQGPGPGVKGRLLREALARHAELSPEDLAAVLNRESAGLGVQFRADDVRHARQILRESPRPACVEDHLLFTDRIPPMREHDNPALREQPPQTGAGG